jgi:uncharacterized protein (DUF433 family)
MSWKTCKDVMQDSSLVGGAWVFIGTRVPVKSLFENLEDGASINDFLEWFPGVTRKQIVTVLEHASLSLTAAS